MFGRHCIKGYSTTQATVAMSSGEAELYAITKGASQALGVMSMAADFGMCLSATVHCDASAALGIVNRQGLGKLRHINVRYLWLQEKVRMKELDVLKVAGTSNPADLMTKNLDAATMWKHLKTLGFYSASGRAELAPRLRSTEEDPNSTQHATTPAAALEQGVQGSPEERGNWIEVVHSKPRLALVTPIRVQGVPPARALTAMRITEGVFVGSGEPFRRVDNWTTRKDAHKVLSAAWTGRTWFSYKEV